MSKGIKEIRKPEWLKVKACGGEKYLEVLSLIKENDLHTVCQEANCPNRGECFSSGTATFLILGPNCTRNCSFCNISPGQTAPVDIDEPERVAQAVEILGLEHAVVTSVTRDDLPDGGAGQFAEVIRAIRRKSNNTTIEVLTPDFKGVKGSILTVLEASPDVYNHNVETAPRLYRAVRPAGDYKRSLDLLQIVAGHGAVVKSGATQVHGRCPHLPMCCNSLGADEDICRPPSRSFSPSPGAVVKSGLMVGLGETEEEMIEVFDDLGRVGVELLTIGQYLSPSANHHPVVKYYSPSEFNRLAELAGQSGIKSVFAGPLVRSSYHAGETFRAK